MVKHVPIIALVVAALACPPAAARSQSPLANLGLTETLNITGTEPFWGGHLRTGRLVFETPEKPKGEVIRVRRTAGPRAISFRGAGTQGMFAMVVRRHLCSDGMSDRDFPFEVTITYARGTLHGCGWSARRPYIEKPS